MTTIRCFDCVLAISTFEAKYKGRKSNKAIGDRMNKTMDIVLSERKLSTLNLKPFELYLICKHAAGTKASYYEEKGEFAQPKLP